LDTYFKADVTTYLVRVQDEHIFRKRDSGNHIICVGSILVNDFKTRASCFLTH